MTQVVIDNLHAKLRNYICSLKTSSKDDAHNVCLSNSLIRVVHFDKLPKDYSRGWLSMQPTSNDALYITEENKWYLIEFKNGSVDKSAIYRKIYDSLIMLVEMGIIKDLNFARENICYILVCRAKNERKAAESPSRNRISTAVRKKAQQNKMMFDLHKFRKYLFEEVCTYNPEEFEQEFTKPMEQKETEVSQLA